MAKHVLGWMLASDALPDAVLNVNVPDVPLGDLRGLRAAGLAAFGAVQATVAETGRGFVTMTFEKVKAGYEPDTDAALVKSGWATVTPLEVLRQAEGVDLSGLAGSVVPA